MDSFEVENFRSLKHLKLEKLARVNLLVGKNNVGKTSVLESIYCLAKIGTPAWFERILRERQVPLLEADFAHLFYGLSGGTDIKLSVLFALRSANAGLAHQLSASLKLQRFFIETESFDLDDTSARTDTSHELNILIKSDATSDPISYSLQLDGRGNRIKRHALRFGDHVVADTGNTNLVAPFLTKTALISSYPRLRNASLAIGQIKVAKEDNELVDVLRQIDSRIERVELGNNGQILFNLGPQFPTLLPASSMGEGIQRLLLLIASIVNSKGGLVLIDEIDNGLHYSALRVLWKGILYAARKHNVQVFATTHSAEALRHLTWVLDEEENASFRDDVAAYTLIRAKDDTVRSFRYDYEQLDFALEHDMEVRN
ncbi:MAG: AAA family ATPase [Janthinobacterium lividum]